MPTIKLEQSSISEESSRQSHTHMKALKIFGITLVSVIVIISLYYSSAWLVTEQIKDKYNAKECSSALEWTDAIKFYPQSLVPFIESAKVKSTECQVYLEALAFQEQMKWEQAYIGYQTYISMYPKGTLMPEVRDGAAQTLFGWAQAQFESKQYEESVIHLLTLLNDHGESTLGGEAKALLFKAYLAYGQNLRAEEKYKQATEIFQTLYDWEIQHNPGNIKPVQLELAETYLAWAKFLYVEKKFDLAFEKLTETVEVDPDPTDSQGPGTQALQLEAGYQKAWGDSLVGEEKYSEAINHYEQALQLASAQEVASIHAASFDATLKWAGALSKSENFYDALVRIDQAKEMAGTEANQERVEDTRETTYLAFSQSSGQESTKVMTNQAIVICKRDELDANVPPILALNPDQKGVYFLRMDSQWPDGHPLSNSYMPQTPGEMHFVACVVQSSRTVQTCAYTGGFSIQIKRYFWTINLYDAVTGQLKMTDEIAGALPTSSPKPPGGTGMVLANLLGSPSQTCPSKMVFSKRYPTVDVTGIPPISDDLVAWLETSIK